MKTKEEKPQKRIIIKVSKADNRNIRVQKRFNDASGHNHIIDMLTDLSTKGWTEADVVYAAFECLFGEWSTGQLSNDPLHPVPQVVTNELRIVSKDLLLIVDQLKGVITSVGGQHSEELNYRLDEVRNTIRFNSVEGSSVYASEIAEIEEIDESWDD